MKNDIITIHKRINAVHRSNSLSGILQDGIFGDKETAVRIRGNSHYRISAPWGGQVGMLIGLFGAKALGKSLLGNEGVDAANDKVGK